MPRRLYRKQANKLPRSNEQESTLGKPVLPEKPQKRTSSTTTYDCSSRSIDNLVFKYQML